MRVRARLSCPHLSSSVPTSHLAAVALMTPRLPLDGGLAGACHGVGGAVPPARRRRDGLLHEGHDGGLGLVEGGADSPSPLVLGHPRRVGARPLVDGRHVVDGGGPRDSGEWIAVGTDSRSRLVELVYEYDDEDDFFFVYHGMTPPSAKTLRELGLER